MINCNEWMGESKENEGRKKFQKLFIELFEEIVNIGGISGMDALTV